MVVDSGQSLFDSVTDARMSLTEWIDFALNNAGAENNINVIRLISNHREDATAYLYRIDMPQELRTEQLQSIENQG